MRYLHSLLVVVVLSGSAGCGKKGAKEVSGDVVARQAGTGESDRSLTKRKNVILEPFKADEGKQAHDAAKKDGVQRKIRYTADISIIVADLGKSTVHLRQIIKDNTGDIAKSEETGSPGTIRQGTWRIRVPVEFFEPFRDAVVKLGDVEKNVTDSEDLTEEYYDLENHIKDRLADQEGWREMLKNTTDKIESRIQVKDKLDQVRSEVNRMQGRLKLITNLTDLTTVTVTMREKQKYDPDKAPDTKETPTFAQRAGRTFEDSMEGLANFGKGIALILIAMAPWLPFVALVAAPGWLVLRRQARQRRLLEEQREAARLAKKKRGESVEALEVVEDGNAPPPEAPKPSERPPPHV